MSDILFVFKYIASSVRDGKNPIEVAKDEIKEVDAKLNELEDLRLRRLKIVKVLDHFGDDSYRRRKATHIPKSGDVPLEESKIFLEMSDRIKYALSKKAGPFNMREIISLVGSYDQDEMIIRAVKHLGGADILARNDDNLIVHGSNWSSGGYKPLHGEENSNKTGSV